MNFVELSVNDICKIKKILNVDDLSLVNYFLDSNEHNYRLYGKFKNKELSCTVGIVDSINITAWILSRKHTSGNIQDIVSIIKELICIKENYNIFQFLTLTNEDEYKVFKNELYRYNSYLEHIVSPGRLTGYESIDHEVLRYEKYPETLKIHIWSLKNEYRTVKK